MRILHVISSLAATDGGPSKVVLEVCRELSRRGEEVEIYTTSSARGHPAPLGESAQIGGLKVTCFTVNARDRYKLSVAMARALRTKVPTFDVVHINSLYQFPATIAAHYCRKYQVPYILRPHGTLDPYLYRRHSLRKRLYERIFERRNLAKAAAVNFTADDEMKLASSCGFKFNGVVVPLGVNPSEMVNSEPAGTLAKLWPETNGKKVVLFLSRINFKKGLDLLCEAFGQLARARDDIHLLLAGPDNEGYGSKVRKWVEEQGVIDKVTFAGMLTGQVKGVALAESELFVLPSYSENFGLAVVEAMAAGLPVVISNKVNIWRHIQEGRAGFVVNTDANEVAGAISTILDNPINARQMGNNGRLVAQGFSWELTATRLMKLYQQVVSQP